MKASTAPRTGEVLRPTLIDRYLLRLTATPLIVSLTVVLAALLMERLLRLFDVLAENGGRVGVVAELLVDLVPHYLGLALPAAFFFSVLAVMTRLSESSEADALQACGLSVARLSAPLVALGVVLTLISLVLFGWLQPLGRYSYRAVLHAAVNGDWTARVQPQVVLNSGGRFTLTADTADPTGRSLGGVFIRRITPDGNEQVVTARSAELQVSPDGRRVSARLRDGTQFADRGPGGGPTVVSFDALDLSEELGQGVSPFRARGGNARELTLTELNQRLQGRPTDEERAELASELHGRLSRALSMPFLPLLAIPLGLAAKRSQGGARLVLAALILLAYHHGLQLGESLGDTGRVPPVLAVWTPFVLFVAFSAWLFASSRQRPGETPLSRGMGRLGVWLRQAREWATPGRAEPAPA